MNYVITGSIGHISKPIVEKLKASGHFVTVITSSSAKVKDIESLGAKAAVGSVEDGAFLKSAFAGAQAVYLMIPPNWALQGSWGDYQKKVIKNYIDAVKINGIKHVVLLSSIGAHLGKGTGPVDGLSVAEWLLNQEKNLNVKILRPSYFYYNLMSMIPLIKNMNIMGSNFGGSKEKLVLTHTSDIANVAAAHLLGLKFKGHTIEYIASDERHPSEIAQVLSKAIAKPGIPWIEFKDEDALKGMLQGGLNPEIANAYVEMGACLREGKMQGDYWKNRPKLGKVKLEEFAKEFAAAFNS
ncbi:MAG: NAD(P)H-binding protein [Bacteroidetes bacterium]|nr:NAD(P)H-binding protein [Bacteroidota bacterium]